MKQITLIFAILLSIFAFTNCAKAQETMFDIKQDDLTKLISVSFEANSTTGYNWIYKISDTTIVNLVSDNYQVKEHDERMVGVGGTQFFIFQPLKAGKVDMEFVYCRPWEKNKTDNKTHSVQVIVKEDKSVKFKKIK